MARKERFPTTEPDTVPRTQRSKTATRQSGPAPKGARERSEAPTLPPPPSEPPPTERQKRAATRRTEALRASNVRSKRPTIPAATVDEVTADLSRDPRRERDDE
jgi:hypothetical protein